MPDSQQKTHQQGLVGAIVFLAGAIVFSAGTIAEAIRPPGDHGAMGIAGGVIIAIVGLLIGMSNQFSRLMDNVQDDIKKLDHKDRDGGEGFLE